MVRIVPFFRAVGALNLGLCLFSSIGEGTPSSPDSSVAEKGLVTMAKLMSLVDVVINNR